MTKYRRHDSAESLRTPEDITFYIEAELEDYNPFHLADAFGAIARSRGVDIMAAETGLSRDAILEALNGDGARGEDTLVRLAEAYGPKRMAPAAE